jgi:hypothetical protein
MSTMRGLAASLLVAFACAPSQSVDRVALDGPVAITGGSGGSDGPGGTPTQGKDGGGLEDVSAGGGVDARPPDAAPDRRPVDAALPDRPAPLPTPDAPVDASPPDQAPDVADTAPEAPLPKLVQLVVGDTATLGPGDVAVRTVLATRLAGYTIRLRDDGGAVDLVNTHLIVIAGSVESGTVANKYRTVPVPVISLEYSLFDNMAMTGGTEDTDYGVAGGTQVDIADATHPLAATLSGTVSVVSAMANVGWGNPGAGAARIATLAGNPGRVAIFAYPKGTEMAAAVMAPARRVGFFALETAAARLTGAGVQLLAAAIDWALLPDP